MKRLVLGVYEDHAGVGIVRVVTIVHTRDWQVGTVLQTTGQEGTSRHGTVPLHGRHREGDPLVVGGPLWATLTAQTPGDPTGRPTVGRGPMGSDSPRLPGWPDSGSPGPT